MPLNAAEGQEVKLGRYDFNSDGISHQRLYKANRVWVSVMTHCSGVAFKIVSGSESQIMIWADLVPKHRNSGLKERRLTIAFYSMKIELGINPRQFLLRIDQIVKNVERVDRALDPNHFNCDDPERVS